MYQKGFSKRILLLIVGGALILAFGIYYGFSDRVYPWQNTEVQIISEDIDSQEVTLRGIVTGIDTGCYVDNVCLYFMNGYEIVWGVGRPQQVVGSRDDNIETGDKIEVYGKKEGTNVVTIYGKEEYYVKNISRRTKSSR